MESSSSLTVGYLKDQSKSLKKTQSSSPPPGIYHQEEERRTLYHQEEERTLYHHVNVLCVSTSCLLTHMAECKDTR